MTFKQTTIRQNGVDRPKQRISTRRKTSEGEFSKNWRKDNVDYFADLVSDNTTYRRYLEDLYKMAAGYLDSASYDYITNPLNTDKTKYAKKETAKLNNYDIITPILMMFMGDKIDRMIKPTVAAINSDIENIRQEQKKAYK